MELADGSLVVIEAEKIIPCERPKGWSGRAAIGPGGRGRRDKETRRRARLMVFGLLVSPLLAPPAC